MEFIPFFFLEKEISFLYPLEKPSNSFACAFGDLKQKGNIEMGWPMRVQGNVTELIHLGIKLSYDLRQSVITH